MRTGLDNNIQATREYQHTNRRVTNITLHPRFTSCSSQSLRIDEKIEEEVLLPVDNISAISAISTKMISDRRESQSLGAN
jgi:hypothetical protein